MQINMIKFFLNGEKHKLQGGDTISALLVQSGISCDRVAVMINESVIKKSAFQSTPIRENDRVEILTFAGGG